jgi:hypothetical protein
MVERFAVFSPCGRYRYTLVRRWEHVHDEAEGDFYALAEGVPVLPHERGPE